MVLPGDCLGDLDWWYKNVEFWNCGILHSQPITIQMSTDASDSGSAGELASMATAFGLWDRVTAHQSINYRELLAVLLALHSFRPLLQ